MRLCLIIIVFSFFTSSSIGQVSGSDYRIFSSVLRREISIEELVAAIIPGQVLIFGEQHDDSIGHLLEAQIFASLYRRFDKKLILSMEMFHRDVQYILDEYLSGQISEKNFIKESRAWDTYKKDYRTTVEFAKDKGLEVVAANAPSRYTNLVTRKGLNALEDLSRNVKKNYIAPLPIDTMTGAYFDRFMETMGGHTVPGMNLYQSQNFWDATMSWSIAQAMKRNKSAVVFMMNGRFHSDYHSGMAGRLTNDYKKKVLTISCFAAENFDQPKWEDKNDIADFVILTRAVPKATAE